MSILFIYLLDIHFFLSTENIGKELTKHKPQPFCINFFFLKMDLVIWYWQWG